MAKVRNGKRAKVEKNYNPEGWYGRSEAALAKSRGDNKKEKYKR